MKIEVFAICYNEEVMLPYFLRHYSQFCDKITIYDNYSTDRSIEICQKYSAKRAADRRFDLPIEIIQYDSGNQIRDDIYLKIKNNCWKQSDADWVIVCDIDELFIQLVEGISIDNFTIIMPDWYEMVSEKLPETSDQIYYEISEGVGQGQISKCIMFKPAALKEINYHPGAHGINPVGDIRILHTSDFGILHYKYLSPKYVIDKHAAYRERLSDINKEMKWGVHYNNTTAQIIEHWNTLWKNKRKVI